MTRHIIHALQVKLDIQDGIYWYNEQQKGLGKKFVSEIKKHLNIIAKNPEGFAIRFDNIRCLPIKKYPYNIYYRFEKNINTIFVEAIFNTNKNPNKWGNR